MNYSRRIVVVSVSTLAVGLLAISATTASAAPTTAVTFKGYAKCGFSGTLTSTPGITNTSAPLTIKLTGTLTTCTGNISQGGVKITGGRAAGVVHATASCTSLNSIAPSMTITWTANSPGATPTKLGFSNASVADGAPITVTLPGSGGTSKATGSFAGTKSTALLVVQQSAGTVSSQCATSKGVSSLNLTKASRITVQ